MPPASQRAADAVPATVSSPAVFQTHSIATVIYMSMKNICIDMSEHRRKVGDRGQVTIPKELRDSRGIKGGDEVKFVEVNDEILIKPPTDDERLAEGYRKRAERSRRIAEEMDEASSEATDRLGEAPDRDD
jgi:AbrB family looped-hinge helix DNA binding protein